MSEQNTQPLLAVHLLTESGHVQQQVETLLRITDRLGESLYSLIGFEEDVDSDVLEKQFKPKIQDGGVRASLEATMMKACDRLDAILDDPKNWVGPRDGFAAQEFLRDKQEDRVLHAAKISYVKTQEAATAEALKPHRVFTPTLAKDGAEWVASYQGANFELFGRGKSPALAFADYDRAFFAELTQEQVNAESETLKD